LAPYFLIVQSEELLLLKPVIFTKTAWCTTLRGFFFVPPNEELEGTLHPQKFGCTPKNDGKRVHAPPDEKTYGHADIKLNIIQVREDTSVLSFPILYFLRKKLGSYGV
jgi:hypothetical protein